MPTDRSTSWRYGVCGLLLMATMLLYMDRLTLSQLATTICRSTRSRTAIWLVDTGFSYAFATGALFFGFLVDRIGPRWLYPTVVIGWSCAGLATAYAETIGAWFLLAAPGPVRDWFTSTTPATVPEEAYAGFMICRIALGFCEAGHWPCALVTTQAIMSRGDRSLATASCKAEPPSVPS